MTNRAILLAGLWLAATPALAVDVPAPGACPPVPLRGGAGEPGSDAVPPRFVPGEQIGHDEVRRLRDYLPREVWEHRERFFYDGMTLEVGPCHRRYPAPPFFDAATRANAGRVSLDGEGNLLGFDGAGLPFDPREIDDDAEDAGARWAWSHRYRYQGAGYRGAFRILHVARRGAKVDRFTGSFFLLPTRGVPGVEGGDGAQFWAGGRFDAPEVARGVAWRQLRSDAADRSSDRSDDVWVWMPEERRVKRAPVVAVDGLYTPSYARANVALPGRLVLPDGTQTPGASAGVVEHTRLGFAGLVLRPNAYVWRLERVQDVIAPINSTGLGYPVVPERSFGPSGLSVASDRWEIRRAVVLRGERRERAGGVATLVLYVDALTLGPLYMVTRRANGHIFEIGIFVGRFSADDPLHPEWEGSGSGVGAILPVGAAFYTAGGTGWVRESYRLRSDPPDSHERRRLTSTTRLQRGR